MTDETSDELEALRRRAYGPQSDIHLDPQAASRLRELEGKSRRSAPAEPRADHEPVSVESSPTKMVTDLVEPGTVEDLGQTGIDWSWTRELLARLLRVRRSTALIVLGSVVTVVLALTALTLVQRGQTAPLGADAEQIARLSIDDSYEIPELFPPSPGEDSRDAFQDFYGLRTVAAFGTAGWFYGTGTGDCFTVFSAEDVDAEQNFSDGLLISGCTAGGFPAATQFEIGAHGVPEELRSAFPESAAFQFVLDADNREIVVFMTR